MFDICWYDYEDCLDIKQLWQRARSTAQTEYVWLLHKSVDYRTFDLSFLPDRYQRDYNHAWASHANPECYTTWLLPKTATEQSVFHTGILPILSRPKGIWQWETSDHVDYSSINMDWFPGVWDWDKSHGFAMEGTTQLCEAHLVNSRANGIKYHTTDLKYKHRIILYDTNDRLGIDDPWVWLCDNRVDYTGFDFTWLPDAWDKNKTHAFCMRGSQQLSYTFLTPVNSEGIVYHTCDLMFKPGITPIMRWQDHPNSTPRLETAKELAIGNEWTWITDSRVDYSSWDFNWLPDAWDTRYIHCFEQRGTNKLSYTWLVHRDALDKMKDYKYHPSNLLLHDHYDMIELKMYDKRLTREGARSQRYMGDMETALRSAIKKSKREWLWVISDCIDYDFQGFDFSWLPDGDQRHYVHCWPSNSQKKGETFLIHVPTYSYDEPFEFCFDHKPLSRMPWPTQPYGVDSLAQAIQIHGTKALYTQFTHTSSADLGQPYPCLWEKRPVIALNRSGSCSLVPRDCVVGKEIYEYPYLERQETLATDPVMDVVFISNGESQAPANHIRLNHVLNRGDSYYHPKSVTDCNGRLNSYKAAARLSSTDWFIAVFAKCYVAEELGVLYNNWTPDYWQEPKHYVFHNHNLDNDLTYGHMAPIAYNRNLILDNPGGLDITLAQPHTVVPIVLSQTSLDGDNWTDWRTSFRETVKLLHYNRDNPTIESEYRLWVWLNKGTEASMKGARDGKDYYERCGGEESWLLMTVEWDWLKKYYESLHR